MISDCDELIIVVVSLSVDGNSPPLQYTLLSPLPVYVSHFVYVVGLCR